MRNSARQRERTSTRIPCNTGDFVQTPGRNDRLFCLHTAEVTGSIPVAPTEENPCLSRNFPRDPAGLIRRFFFNPTETPRVSQFPHPTPKGGEAMPH